MPKKDKAKDQNKDLEFADIIADAVGIAVGEVARKGTKTIIKSVEQGAGSIVNKISPAAIRKVITVKRKKSKGKSKKGSSASSKKKKK